MSNVKQMQKSFNYIYGEIYTEVTHCFVGFPFLMVISSIAIASGSAEGISGYVHGDL